MGSIKKNIAGKSIKAKKGLRIAIVRSDYNPEIVDALYNNCQNTLFQSDVSEKNIRTVRVPGAFELPLVCQKLAASKKFDAVIALGAVIRGDTPHFDYVASCAAMGIMEASLKTNIPIVFGVLTTNNTAQARARTNKGTEAALTALHMSQLIL